jgi:hypothetical protein
MELIKLMKTTTTKHETIQHKQAKPRDNPTIQTKQFKNFIKLTEIKTKKHMYAANNTIMHSQSNQNKNSKQTA